MAVPSSVPKIRTDLAYYGVVTRVISNTQFVAAGLAGLGNGALAGYLAYVMAKANGTTTPPHAEQPAVTVYVSSSGTFTHAAYTAPLAVGDRMLLLHPSIAAVGAGVATLLGRLTALRAGYLDELDFDLQGALTAIAGFIDTEVTAIKTATDKLAGAPPVVGTVAANWFSGVATSGEAGADLVNIGANDIRNKLHSLIVDISRGGLVGTGVKIKLFMQVDGVENKVYEQTFDATADPGGVWVVNGTVGIHEVLRVEVESDVVGDDAKNVHYDYMLEAM